MGFGLVFLFQGRQPILQMGGNASTTLRPPARRRRVTRVTAFFHRDTEQRVGIARGQFAPIRGLKSSKIEKKVSLDPTRPCIQP